MAINKPAGLLCHASLDLQRPDAQRILTRQLDLPELYLAHRLDRDTSGVLLFAKSPQHQAILTELFKARKIHKTYLAVTRKKPTQEQWSLHNHLGLEKVSAGKAPRTVAVRSGGQKAVTDFRVLLEQKKFWLIEAKPKTGRRHQIRSHLADSGLPIIGDKLYGGQGEGRFLLHAWKLEWQDSKGNAICIEAPLPQDFPVQKIP